MRKTYNRQKVVWVVKREIDRKPLVTPRGEVWDGECGTTCYIREDVVRELISEAFLDGAAQSQLGRKSQRETLSLVQERLMMEAKGI